MIRLPKGMDAQTESHDNFPRDDSVFFAATGQASSSEFHTMATQEVVTDRGW